MPCLVRMHYKPFLICDMLYWFLKKPTVTAEYTKENLKRLLKQRWTGHLAPMSVIVNSFGAIVQFLMEIDSSGLQLFSSWN